MLCGALLLLLQQRRAAAALWALQGCQRTWQACSCPLLTCEACSFVAAASAVLHGLLGRCHASGCGGGVCGELHRDCSALLKPKAAHLLLRAVLLLLLVWGPIRRQVVAAWLLDFCLGCVETHTASIAGAECIIPSGASSGGCCCCLQVCCAVGAALVLLCRCRGGCCPIFAGHNVVV